MFGWVNFLKKILTATHSLPTNMGHDVHAEDMCMQRMAYVHAEDGVCACRGRRMCTEVVLGSSHVTGIVRSKFIFGEYTEIKNTLKLHTTCVTNTINTS